jgi:annexin A7/11
LKTNRCESWQPPNQQWQQPPPPGGQQQYGGYPQFQPTPASPGYDPAQKQWAQHVDTTLDAETLRKAMKGFGCNERAIIDVYTMTKYQNPWAMQQLAKDYNSRFMRELAKDIESETRGDFETALLALTRGPLANEVYVLEKALNRAGTDEEALNDILLCRSNADMRAIIAEYRKTHRRELLGDIKNDVDDTMYRLYSMVLTASRAEDAAPVIAAEIDHKVTDLQRATEGQIGANAIAVAQILTSSNSSQIHAMSEAYQRKFHRKLQDVIEKEFRGDLEDALLFMLTFGMDRSRADAQGIRSAVTKTVRKDKILINRVFRLYLDRARLDAAKVAYKKMFGVTMTHDLKEFLSGDYEGLLVAMTGK